MTANGGKTMLKNTYSKAGKRGRTTIILLADVVGHGNGEILDTLRVVGCIIESMDNIGREPGS